MVTPPQQVQAPDGRRITFEVHGPVGGPPVYYFHGVPSSSAEVHLLGVADAARRVGVRLVAIDRPGIGGTDPRPDRSLLDTADDLGAVADALGHPRVALLGYSAGSPFALATAVGAPQRTTGIGIVSGIAPGDRPELTIGQADEVARMFAWARSNPRRLRLLLRGMRLAIRLPGLVARSAARGAPAADRAVLAADGAGEKFSALLEAAFRQGIDGVARDTTLVAGGWPFPLDAITRPVVIWHGEQDRNAPVPAAHWLHGALAASTLHISPEDGHASLLAGRARPILEELAALP